MEPRGRSPRRGNPRGGDPRRGNSRGNSRGRGPIRGDPRGNSRGRGPRRGNPRGNPRMGYPGREEPIRREPKKRNKFRSFIMICLILAFIVGMFIGVSQILDLQFGSDDNETSNVTYVDVTNNLSYYENASQNDYYPEDDGSDSDVIYNNSNVKVINSSK